MQNHKGYKKTELGWIPEEWEVVKFGEIVNINMGQSPEGHSYNNKGIGVALINGPTEFTEKFPIEKQWTTKPTKLCEKGDMLLCVRGSSTGRINIADKSYCIGRGVAAISKTNLVAKELIEYMVQSITSSILALTTGSTFPNIDSKTLKSIKIPLPPLPEQESIARILGTMDRQIQTQTALIRQKEVQKKWLMQQLLTGKKRLKGFEGEWEEMKMEDIFERVTRKNTEANTNVVTISAQRGFVRQNDYFNKIVASEILDNYFLVQKDEFCYNKSYSNGYPWGATKRLKDYDKAVVTTLYICFGLKNKKTSSVDFFEHFFEANLLDKGLTEIAHEGGRAHGLLNVTPKDFFGLKIKIPTLSEQSAIAKVLNTADRELQLLNAQLDKLKELKKGLMQVLLTGRVRVKGNKFV